MSDTRKRLFRSWPDGYEALHRRSDRVNECAPAELTRLVNAAIEINGWDRLAITLGSPEPGSYTRAES